MIVRPAQRRQESVAFNATSTLFDYGALTGEFDSNSTFTVLALVRPVGSGEGGFSYIFGKVPSSTINGARFFIDHNAGSPRLTIGLDSATAGVPLRAGTTGLVAYGNWYWVAATSLGTVTATDLRLYSARYGDQLREQAYGTATNGTTALDANTAESWTIGNRAGSDRTFNGDIALICRWNKALSLHDLREAVLHGPLSVERNRLVFLQAGFNEVAKGLVPTVTASAPGNPVSYILRTRGVTIWPAFDAGLSAVTKDSDLRWDVISAIQKDSSLRWDVLSAVQRDADLRWDLLSALSKDATLQWDLLSTLQKDSTFVWDLLAALSKDVDLRWDVQSTLSAVNRDLELRWDVLSSALRSLTAQWDVLTTVQKDENLLWDIAIAAAKDVELRWDLNIAAQKDVTMQWSVISTAQNTITLQWTVQSENAGVIATRHIYVLPKESNVHLLPKESGVYELPAEDQVIVLRSETLH